MYVVFAIVTAGKPDFPKPFLIRKLQCELDTVSLIHPSAPVRLAMNVVADIHLEQESRAVMSEPDFRTQILAPLSRKDVRCPDGSQRELLFGQHSQARNRAVRTIPGSTGWRCEP